MSVSKKILLVTALSFNKRGNQSLKRFVEMLTQANLLVDIYTSVAFDNNNSKTIENGLIIKKISSLHELIIKYSKKVSNKPQPLNNPTCFYEVIRSDDVIPPFGNHTLTTMLRKWFLFFIYLIDNLLLCLWAIFINSKKVKEYDVIIGYECGYTIFAKIISKIYKIKYINKYQGTVLKFTKRNMRDAKKYYPLNYFGINSSDLCIMVNDGTDGKFYAEKRGCKNIYFEPHGVAVNEYSANINEDLYDLKPYNGKFILFNNASTSTWKRTDRIIRAICKLGDDIRKKIVFLTTYNGPDKAELINYAASLKLNNTVKFLDNVNYLQSNYLIRKSDVVIMTNEMSNLGNPILESLYYGIPVISINDGSLENYVINNVNGILIDLDSNFDNNLCYAISKCVNNKVFYAQLQNSSRNNKNVFSLEDQQRKELNQIIKIINAL